MAAWIVYVTTKDKSEALRIGQTLVEGRLAACVNILDGMTSIYHWEGEIEESAEAVMIAKTRGDLVPALIEQVQRLHSYACPCIEAWPIEMGHAAFLNWIERETR